MKIMTDDFNEKYEAEVSAIFTRFPSFQKVGAAAYKPGIEGMLAWDEAAGRPHERYRSVHVAGTNGKGSVSHLIASVLASAGYRVGLYTSPHILDFRERIKVCNGKGGMAKYISKEGVYDFLMKWKQYFIENRMSFFEITTMMAFDWFAREHVDFAVVETGLGGRLDSTNIITPVLSVITNIGLDHCDLLGDTRAKIAFEKAGIIKPGVPVVIGEDDPEIAPVFEEKARDCGSALCRAQEIYPVDSPVVEELFCEMDLKGEYQRHNVSTALTALSVLKKENVLDEGAVDESVVYDGITGAASRMRFLGRWQDIRKGRSRLIVDIGHNAHGLKYNFSQLGRLFVQDPSRKAVMVLGFVADKDVDAALAGIPCPDGRNIEFVFTNAASPRALPAHELERHFLLRYSGHVSSGSYSVRVVPRVADAVMYALEACGPEGGIIYIGGSTFVVAEALPALGYKDS